MKVHLKVERFRRADDPRTVMRLSNRTSLRVSKFGLVLLPLWLACYPRPFTEVQPVSRSVVDDGGQVRKAVALLRDTEEFAAPYVGFAGAPSDQVLAFQRILNSDSADESFKWLLSNATLPGQLYGLSGLYFTDRKLFESEVERFKAMKGDVAVIEGCEVSSRAVSAVVWVRPWGDSDREVIDIAGGGWPLLFRDAFEN